MKDRDEMGRILISCAGVGMGNASRVAAIVEALHNRAALKGKKVSCHIVTWGSALTFLKEYKRESGLDFELISAHSYGAASVFVDFFSLRGLVRFFRTYARNIFFLRRAVRRLRPALIILDSDYHFPAYFRSGAPILYIGQASDVLERARRDSYRPQSWRERMNFNFREKLDSILQGLFSNWVLVPSFSCTGDAGSKVKKIPLIVRKEFLARANVAENAETSVGILLSGSELEKSAFIGLAEKYDLKILTPGKSEAVPSHAATLDQFGIIFTQGGLSSISECIARSKFLVVFPMQYHPEQLLNAVAVEKLGLGMRSSLEELGHFPQLLREIVERKENSRKTRVGLNGADVAASFIFQTLIGLEVQRPELG